MFVILPFEKDYYSLENYNVNYVGHPLLDVIDISKNVYEKNQKPAKKSKGDASAGRGAGAGKDKAAVDAAAKGGKKE